MQNQQVTSKPQREREQPQLFNKDYDDSDSQEVIDHPSLAAEAAKGSEAPQESLKKPKQPLR